MHMLIVELRTVQALASIGMNFLCLLVSPTFSVYGRRMYGSLPNVVLNVIQQPSVVSFKLLFGSISKEVLLLGNGCTEGRKGGWLLDEGWMDVG